nr:putative Ig domain-containing protein [Acetatifactor sp.]
MKGVKTFLNKRAVAAIAAAAMVAQCMFSPLAVQTVHADTTEQTIESLVKSYTPTITQTTNVSSGFVHPGVGMTKDLLDNVQSQVRNGVEPWKTYFEDMLASAAASKTPEIKLTNPSGTVYNSAGTNGLFRTDALTAYTQAVLYYVTGDNVYRKNALNIIRAWSQLDPTKYAYFTDACIHVGIPMNRMCIAAEIIRYSSYEVTEGYTDADLNWTEDEITAFINNLVSPAVNTFMSSRDEFMNQHLYTTIGAMSAYLFMDDAEGYAKTVEWFTVNKDGANPGFNGSIERLFRKTTTIDEVGGTEGTGTPLRDAGYDMDYVIQHVEMGRDQAHGCGDLTNAAILSRMMLGQGTKVDPVNGTVSTAADAVTCYEFLDDRILEAADFFFKYMLGYDATWVPVPYSIRDTDGDGDKEIVDFYREYSPQYRGRYQTINFWDLYSYYTYVDHSKNLQQDYPYFYEGFMKKMPSNYIWNGDMGINWDNVDGGGDFWLFLPAEAAADSDTLWLAEEQNDYQVQVETRGSMVDNQEAMTVSEDAGTKYVHFTRSAAESKLAIHSGGVGSQTIAFRIRTDGVAKLSLSNGVKGCINLPNTNGEWQYVTFTRNDSEGFGDLYYVIVSDIAGSYVDIDSIDIKPTQRNAARTVDVLNFVDGNEDLELVSFAGAPISLNFAATDNVAGSTISYSGIQLPEGASVNSATGAFNWTPSAANTYSFYICAKANDTELVKKVTVVVVADREAAIANAIAGYDENEIYISATKENFLTVLDETRAMVGTATDEAFAAQLNRLNTACKELALVSPILAPDTMSAGGSLDYTKMVASSTTAELQNLADSDASFCGYYSALTGSDGMKYHILDFGPDFRVSLTKVGYKARLGFPDRLAGVQIMGSNDGENWTQLTVSEAEYNQAYQEVDIKTEEQNNKYRYIKIYKAHNYPEALRGQSGSLLEFSEFRMWGTRYEIGNKIESISMSSDEAVSQRVRLGDTVKLFIRSREPLSAIEATIQGVNATVAEGTEANTYVASAVMTSGCDTGDVRITVDYTKQNGTAGERFYGTTDGSSLFLVNSDIYINTAMLAENLTASNGSWDGRLNPEQCAALLFDGNASTFSDLKNATGDYYTVDFGEGVTVGLSEVMFMPRSTAQNHADRLNGAIVSGSNDGENWTQITPAVSGAVMNQWTQIKENVLL